MVRLRISLFHIALALTIGSGGATADTVRTWTDSTGRYTVEAKFVEQRGDNVVLRRSDGREITVPVAELSDADRRFLHRQDPPTTATSRSNSEKGSEADAAASSVSGSPSEVSFRNEVTIRLRLGMEVTGQGGTSSNLVATFPVPMDWPEQKVAITQTDTSPQVKGVRYRTLNDGVRQAEFRIPRLQAGESASVVLTLEVQRSHIVGPAKPETLRIPKRLDRGLRDYLRASPKIEVRHPEIRSQAAELAGHPDHPVWFQVESIYDWVRNHVQPNGTRPLKGALAALREGTGDCEERTSLFVALCRVHGIPARSVWVPGHAYAEFYLEAHSGEGSWFPCESLGPKNFGSMPRHQVIMQKGDNFKMAQKKERQRYVSETLSGQTAGGAQPTIRPILEFLEGPVEISEP